MKKKILAWCILFLLPCVCVKAQENNEQSRSETQEVWVKKSPKKNNWFISLNAGVADLMAEESRYANFSDRIKPTFGLGVGKWISPVLGVRLHITGAKLQGWTSWDQHTNTGDGNWYIGTNYADPYGLGHERQSYIEAFNPLGAAYVLNHFVKDAYTTDKRGFGYTYEMTYAAASADLLVNMRNLFLEDKSGGLFNPIIYGGIGYAHTFKEKGRTAVNNIMEKVGLMFDFQLNKHWSFNVDGQLLLLPEIFDRRAGDDKTQDAVANYTLGFTYNFGEGWNRAVVTSQSEIDNLNNQINVLRAELNKKPNCPDCPKVSECVNVEVSGQVRDRDGNVVNRATVFVLNETTQKVTVLRTNDDGRYQTTVPCGASLVIKATKSGYMEDCMTFTASSDRTGKTIQTQLPRLSMDKFKVGQVMIIENIYYDYNKWDIRLDAAEELNKTVEFLKENPQIKVELGSHTDSRGSATYNQTLSQRRAQAAVNYIVGEGIAKTRITAKGYGESRLTNGCKDGVPCTDEQHQANRRTELKITGVEGEKAPVENWTQYSHGQIISVHDLPRGFFSKCR